MKKLLIVVLVLGLLLVGCESDAGENTKLINNEESEMNKEADVSEGLPLDPDADAEACQIAYDQVGEIIQMNDNTFHILTGDIIEVYTVSDEVVNDFFIGDTVGLVKNGEHYEVYLYEVTNNLRRYTTMGDYIHEVTGEVISLSETELIIESDETHLSFELMGPVFADVGHVVTVDYIETLEGTIFLDLYNESNKLSTEVIYVERSEEGVLVVHLGVEGEVSYIATLNHTIVNFQLNELLPGDQVDVYFEIAALSYPAQIGPKKMWKTD